MPDARVEYSPLLGPSPVYVAVGHVARVSFSPLLGDVSPVVGHNHIYARPKFSALLGEVAAAGGIPAQGTVEISPLLGGMRATATNQADLWGYYNLPCPRLATWEIGNNPGLRRAPMISGHVRQRARHLTGHFRPARLSVLVNHAQLVSLASLLAAVGAGWFGVQAISEDGEGVHIVRAISPIDHGGYRGEYLEASFEVEVQ